MIVQSQCLDSSSIAGTLDSSGGVIDQNVQPSELLFDLTEERGYLVFISQVRSYAQAANTESFDLFLSLSCGAMIAQVVEDDVRSSFGELERDSLPDSARPSSNQRDLAVEPHMAMPPSMLTIWPVI